MNNSEIIINGQSAGKDTLIKIIQAFQNPQILKLYGGYIFSFRILRGIKYIGIKPSIIEGQRSNHYDLDAGPEDNIFLTGTILTNGEISLLFKIQKKEMDTNIKLKLKELYIQFASLLVNNKYTGPGKFDWVTKKIFQESEIFDNTPITVYDLCL